MSIISKLDTVARGDAIHNNSSVQDVPSFSFFSAINSQFLNHTMNSFRLSFAIAAALSASAFSLQAADISAEDRAQPKQEIITAIESQAKHAQVMNDMIFSFAELGFQEFETSGYLTAMLAENGFEVALGIAGIPTAWMASWGEGEPVIALGSDIDGIPKASQKPGVAYADPIIVDAPGHGEGHNSGQVVNILAALAIKEIMQERGYPGTIKIWPGVAEELLATKAFYVRDGYFKDVDAVLFSHVSDTLGTNWGAERGNGLISVQYDFVGESAHSAGAPWRGKSALDAVTLMDIGMNFRREHLRFSQRTHSVIVDGGDQPNVVPSRASIWHYFRERDYESITALWKIGDDMAAGAALMTGTSWSSTGLGTAWPGHFNKAMAECNYEHAQMMGMPEWSEADITLAKAVQAELGVEQEGLNTEIQELSDPPQADENTGGGSDDIGDISGTSRPSRCAIRPTFRICLVTIGLVPLPLPWPHRSRTKA